MYLTRRKNPDGSYALYETVCKRVPEYSYPRQFKTCIGKEVDGEFIPNRYYIEREEKKQLAVEASSLKQQLKNLEADLTRRDAADDQRGAARRKKAGATYLFEQMCLEQGFSADLETVFGAETAKRIRSLAYYMILTRGAALDDFVFFDRSHEHPWGKEYSLLYQLHAAGLH